MPNHITNRLTITGNADAVKLLLSTIATTHEDGRHIPIDFGKIVPMPNELQECEENNFVMPLSPDSYHQNVKMSEHLKDMRARLPKMPPERAEKEVENFILGIRNYLKNSQKPESNYFMPMKILAAMWAR